MKKSIEELLDAIISVDTIFYDNPNGPYQESCPFCGAAEGYKGGDDTPQMSDLSHTDDCIYTLARKELYPEQFI